MRPLALAAAVAFLWLMVAVAVVAARGPGTVDTCTSTAVQWVRAGAHVVCVDR